MHLRCGWQHVLYKQQQEQVKQMMMVTTDSTKMVRPMAMAAPNLPESRSLTQGRALTLDQQSSHPFPGPPLGRGRPDDMQQLLGVAGTCFSLGFVTGLPESGQGSSLGAGEGFLGFPPTPTNK